MSKKPTKRTFQFGTKTKGVTITIKESFSKDFVCHVWPSAILLSEYLWDNPSIIVKKRILEIGSGCGLPSLLSAKLGCDKVVITDAFKFDKILKLIEKEIELNDDDIKSKCSVQGLTWGRFTKQNIKLSPHVIIATDIFYDENDFENIICTLHFYFNNGCEVFYAVLQHRGTVKLLGVLLMKWQMKVEEIDIDDIIYKSNFLTLEETDKLMLVKITSRHGNKKHHHARVVSVLGKSPNIRHNVSRSVSSNGKGFKFSKILNTDSNVPVIDESNSDDDSDLFSHNSNENSIENND